MTAESGTPLRPAADARDARWRMRAVERVAIVLGSLLFGVTFGSPALQKIGAVSMVGDWDQNFLFHWVPYETVARYHQMPLWNPWACGGTPMLADPPSRILTPLFALHLAFGPVVALKLEVVAHLAIAAAGSYVLARTLGLRRIASVASAVVFPACSYHYLHIGVGHTSWLPYAYLPWIAAAVWRGLETDRLVPAALAGLLIAVVIGEGGMYAGPHAALLAGTLAVTAAISQRGLRPLAILGATAAFALGFALPKLLPTWQLMRIHSRLVDSHEATSLSTLATALFSRSPPNYLPTWDYDFHEYGAYVGPCAATLAVAGIVLAWRHAWPWIVVALAFLTLTLGDLGRLSPWALLHHVPPFSSQHVPSRFIIVFVLALGVLAGHGAEALMARRRRWGTVAVVLLTVAGAADAFLVSTPHLRSLSDDSQSSRLPPSPEFRQMRDLYPTRMFAIATANMGALRCYDPVGFDAKPKWPEHPGYRGEQYLIGAGTVRLARWTPNALEYDVDLPAPDTLVVNQNFDTAWTLAGGKGRVYDRDGLLAVHLPAGQQHVILRYRSLPFLAGVGASLLSLVALAITWWRERLRPDPPPATPRAAS